MGYRRWGKEKVLGLAWGKGGGGCVPEQCRLHKGCVKMSDGLIHQTLPLTVLLIPVT